MRSTTRMEGVGTRDGYFGRGGVRRALTALGGLLVLGGVAAIASCESMGGGSATSATPSKPAAPYTSEPVLRVRIATSQREVVLAGPSAVLVRERPGQGALLETPVRLTSSNDGIAAADHAGAARHFPRGQTLTVEAAPGRPGPALTVNGRAYPGLELRLHPRSDGTMDVVELIPIETYLPGVIAGELLAGWPLAAFEAQAVAARSYALHQQSLSTAQGRWFDLESTTADQVYTGSTTDSVANQAVRNTRGTVVMWEGRVLRAYYSSTCGGRAASAANTWPTGVGYEFNLDQPIQAQPREAACYTSPLFQWQTERSRDEVSARIRAWGKANGNEIRSLGTLASVAVAGLNAAGRPNLYAVRDTEGRSFRLNPEQLRLALNTSAEGFPDIDRTTRCHSGDLEIDVFGTRTILRGRGFGHGVGMCQYCTAEFAHRGEGWRTMIERFYPGAQIVKAY